MNKDTTLYKIKDITEKFNISRQIIERYKMSGLIKETTRNKYGDLLFDDEAVKRIIFIRFLRSLGLNIPEIKIVIDSSFDELKDFVKIKNIDLNNQIKELKTSISILEKLSLAISKEEAMDITASQAKKTNKGK